MGLSDAELRDMYVMVSEIHEFVTSLKNAGKAMAQNNTPMGIMMRNAIPVELLGN